MNSIVIWNGKKVMLTCYILCSLFLLLTFGTPTSAGIGKIFNLFFFSWFFWDIPCIEEICHTQWDNRPVLLIVEFSFIAWAWWPFLSMTVRRLRRLFHDLKDLSILSEKTVLIVLCPSIFAQGKHALKILSRSVCFKTFLLLREYF